MGFVKALPGLLSASTRKLLGFSDLVSAGTKNRNPHPGCGVMNPRSPECMNCANYRRDSRWAARARCCGRQRHSAGGMPTMTHMGTPMRFVTDASRQFNPKVRCEGAMASNEQLVNLLGHALCGSMKHTATGEIEDSDGRIAAGIAGNVFHSLSVISPSVDGAEHVREQARKRGGVVRPPMSNEEIDRLSKLCTSIANAQYAGITLGTGGAGPY